ncbi:hypothetical protein B0H16DRAFT_1466254 [Mycena metata]|uniref:Uncharacterized protein n=1 Tax=Mycena metata TaxID=1033252 RepID=A0AAD7MY50_9AGAR|nr:hypothetical protein B0H16DRAFT_1466254 [Mycena metata]
MNPGNLLEVCTDPVDIRVVPSSYFFNSEACLASGALKAHSFNSSGPQFEPGSNHVLLLVAGVCQFLCQLMRTPLRNLNPGGPQFKPGSNRVFLPMLRFEYFQPSIDYRRDRRGSIYFLLPCLPLSAPGCLEYFQVKRVDGRGRKRRKRQRAEEKEKVFRPVTWQIFGRALFSFFQFWTKYYHPAAEKFPPLLGPMFIACIQLRQSLPQCFALRGEVFKVFFEEKAGLLQLEGQSFIAEPIEPIKVARVQTPAEI